MFTSARRYPNSRQWRQDAVSTFAYDRFRVDRCFIVLRVCDGNVFCNDAYGMLIFVCAGRQLYGRADPKLGAGHSSGGPPQPVLRAPYACAVLCDGFLASQLGFR